MGPHDLDRRYTFVVRSTLYPRWHGRVIQTVPQISLISDGVSIQVSRLKSRIAGAGRPRFILATLGHWQKNGKHSVALMPSRRVKCGCDAPTVSSGGFRFAVNRSATRPAKLSGGMGRRPTSKIANAQRTWRVARSGS